MPLAGKAVLAVWNDVDPAIEDTYNDWYLHEHIPERLGVPGMLRGRRYRADAGSPRYMAFYEAATIEVLTSGAYRNQLANPTDLTRRVMPGFRLMQRGICSVAGSLGEGIGGAAAVIHLRPHPGAEAALCGWAEGLLPGLGALRQVCGAHLWRVAPAEPASPTTALTQGTAVERPVHLVVAVEALETAALEAAVSAVTGGGAAAHGAAEVMVYPPYRLLYVQTAGDG
jgi:hypothetical protein